VVRQLGVAPLVRELDAVAQSGRQRDALAEDALVALEGQVAEPQLAPGPIFVRTSRTCASMWVSPSARATDTR
jgi:hypothetical protein